MILRGEVIVDKRSTKVELEVNPLVEGTLASASITGAQIDRLADALKAALGITQQEIQAERIVSALKDVSDSDQPEALAAIAVTVSHEEIGSDSHRPTIVWRRPIGIEVDQWNVYVDGRLLAERAGGGRSFQVPTPLTPGRYFAQVSGRFKGKVVAEGDLAFSVDE